MNYYLYILRSLNFERYYVGISENVERRLKFHNTIEKGFTSRYRPWEVVFKQEFSGKEAAMKAEKKVKGWKSRKMIEKLIIREINIPR
ncbi:MAG TPA: GIY-YIG nuclease family protein [Ignavibacteriaceae bacterium]|nr:GIY-YIG nuclease family protein [Ignavibacteriaceae bacterium]HRP91576.1 GIY-YIG nuclease family protein [Ignavibacteriaceae bacterium]HRQ53187.1 GIY-YIG nuclease family protein [Ignavibacteriaceae bacterium]